MQVQGSKCKLKFGFTFSLELLTMHPHSVNRNIGCKFCSVSPNIVDVIEKYN